MVSIYDEAEAAIVELFRVSACTSSGTLVITTTSPLPCPQLSQHQQQQAPEVDLGAGRGGRETVGMPVFSPVDDTGTYVVGL